MSQRQKRPVKKPATPLQAYGESNVGVQRQANEDSYIDLDKIKQAGQQLPSSQAITQRGRLWVVADGMGGHVGGKEASSMVAHQMMQQYYTNQAANPKEGLIQAINHANMVVYDYAAKHPDLEGMGSTLVAAVLKDATLHIAWVGDSRAYLLRAGQLTRLTRDHSWVQQAIDNGTLTEAEAATHPNRSVILRSIGARPEIEPGFRPVEVQRGDIYLLCSDGLTGVVSDQDIQRILQTSSTEQQAVKRLIARANENGGPDNITAAAISLGGFSGAAAAASAQKAAQKRNPWLWIGGGAAATLLLLAAIFILSGIGSPDRAPTPEKNETQSATDAIATDTVTVTTEAESAAGGTLTPTATVTPLPTQTNAGAAGDATPAATVAAVQTVTPTGTVTDTFREGITAPVLLEPKEGDTLHTNYLATFRWRYEGELPENTGFDIRIWLDGVDPDHLGAVDASELNNKLKPPQDGVYEYSFKPESAASVKQHGTQENYHWTVAVVQLEIKKGADIVQPYQRIPGTEAEPHKITIAFPGPSGGGGGGD